MKDIYDAARERMKGFCRVCPNCDGRACSGEVPGMGGIGSGAAFRNNISALSRIKLNMELIHGVKNPDTSCRILGLRLGLPVIAAPIGGVSFNMGGAISEEDYAKAVINGCAASETIGATGDGVPDFIYKAGLAAITAAGGQGIPFIKPWENPERERKLEEALGSGCKVVGVDIDAAGLITLRKMGRPVTPLSLLELRDVARKVQSAGAAFVVKGIMTPRDAIKAAEAGVDGIVVSNHGGRVLDHTPGTAEVLPAVVEAVKGHVAILADGGVRTGQDVFKMLALGAEAVLVGRPVSIAAIGKQTDGVKSFFEQLGENLRQTMVLTGRAAIKSIDRSAVTI